MSDPRSEYGGSSRLTHYLKRYAKPSISRRQSFSLVKSKLLLLRNANRVHTRPEIGCHYQKQYTHELGTGLNSSGTRAVPNEIVVTLPKYDLLYARNERMEIMKRI